MEVGRQSKTSIGDRTQSALTVEPEARHNRQPVPGTRMGQVFVSGVRITMRVDASCHDVQRPASPLHQTCPCISIKQHFAFSETGLCNLVQSLM